MIFALYERPKGVAVAEESRVVYDVGRDLAFRGPARVDGPAIVWTVNATKDALVADRDKGGASLAVEIEFDRESDWIVRCDRVDFPPGAVAHRHVHPGPGIRRLLFGELTIAAEDGTHTYGAAETWFEGADYPVQATASAVEDTAFVRVLLLPRQWEGRRTIHYLDPADEDRPKLQRASVLLEEALHP